MNYYDKSKEELISLLQEIKQRYNSLRELLKKYATASTQLKTEKDLRAQELLIANKELLFQNEEKEKRAAELLIANKELAFLNEEKEKRAIELILAKERAEESDRLKTAFLQNMSHEIRTPMNGILGFAELLKTPKLSGEEQQEYINLIEQSGQRMLNIINDIVNISKIEIGEMDLIIKKVHVNSLLKHLYQFFKPEADRKGLDFSYKTAFSDELCDIETDDTKLTQVLSNLIKNSLKFTKAGSIDFGYHCEENVFKFYIHDTGIGILPELQDSIFKRFRQVDMSVGRNYEGAGLGLAISKSYVEKLGGQIWVESELGKGATFFFTIPYHHTGPVTVAPRIDTPLMDA